ncbi:transcriptional Coactivator p15-domain-containing protein [Boeremia exigua]|uniref:transcriptional Coactivator p15-domain-containing protein n=1 Tax=Boeremia exigua TaxID=749465 RepID=UPI001E8E160D|nr:transcriptional Coactivator p15-domain-containing protein [Boeremia exigua]KAH6643622.1 transcriptional Coactivator p15-domain-containing protein [Boeremia exigua]
MAGTSKRGGFRGGGSGGFKKGSSKKRSPEDDNDTPHMSKKAKGDEDEDKDDTPFVPKLQTDEDNNAFVALNHSGKRRVTVSEFKGMTLVSIREYWANDGGELKPGKKGISLSIEQYNALLAAAPLLESVLAKKDIQATRPQYGAEANTAEDPEDETDGHQLSASKASDDEDGE